MKDYMAVIMDMALDEAIGRTEAALKTEGLRHWPNPAINRQSRRSVDDR